MKERTEVLLTIRTSDGREWVAAALVMPLIAKDGSRERADLTELEQRSPSITGFQVIVS